MDILLVEDDARVGDFLERGLRAEGHTLRRARTGPEGLALARDLWREQQQEHRAAVMVLDVMLPGLSGLEVCQQLRAARVRLPILMLTALGALEDRVAGLRLGADDYLAKPFAFEELLARLEALARRSQAGGEPAANATATLLRVADLELDREQMRARRAGAPLPLTARELALLELLMSHPGRLFSRERILATVWGTSQDPLTNVVDVYIRRLRSKVDEGHAHPLIHTVRGLGYRLEGPAEPG
jgi:DNA-binding response OmpR family regulator